jgi:hypothetical protein
LLAGEMVRFLANADGLRVGKETPSESRKFIYDFRKLLQETDGADDPQRWYTFTTEEYGDLISQYDGADTLFHQYDGLGSTDALLDEWETATDRYAHRAFGLEAARSGTTDNAFTYVGRQGYYNKWATEAVVSDREVAGWDTFETLAMCEWLLANRHNSETYRKLTAHMDRSLAVPSIAKNPLIIY